MPEQLTKHPDVTLQVLRSAGGARCAEGAPQTILKACPAERFCALPGGEICVYGLPDAQRMTQITAAELIAAAGGQTAALAQPVAPAPAAGTSLGAAAGGLGVGLAIGAVLAVLAARRRRR